MDLRTAKRLFIWGLEFVDRETTDTPEDERIGDIIRQLQTEPSLSPDERSAIIEEAARLLASMPGTPADDANLDLSAFLDEVGEHLWGCHEVIEAPASALEVIGLEPGDTYQDAVRMRALSNILDSGMFSPEEERQALHAIFLKDQAGHHRPEVDQAAFQQWLRAYVRHPEEFFESETAE